MTNVMFTQLPTVAAANPADIICAVQGGVSVQETLQQVASLFLSSTILTHTGNPNGNVAGTTFQLLWDTTDDILWVATTTGTPTTTIWTQTSVPPSGSGATGTWSINISGNAATATTATTAGSATTAANLSGLTALTLYGNPTGVTATGQDITLGTGLKFTGDTLVPAIITAYVVGPQGNYTTIQSAINAAVAAGASATNLALVLVAAGIYNENLTLASFVTLANAGGIAKNSVIVNGNATYTPTGTAQTFTSSGIAWRTPTSGGVAFSVLGTGTCTVTKDGGLYNGIYGTAFACSNPNATIIITVTDFYASTGQSILNISAGSFTSIAGNMHATDTSSLISGTAVVSLINGYIGDSYTLSGTATFTVSAAVCVSPSTLAFLTLGTGTFGYVLECTINCNSASGYWVSGTGVIEYGALVTTLGGSTLINPTLTINGQVLSTGNLSFNGGTTAISANGQLIIGNGTTGIPAIHTLTAGTGITVTNGPGTITIASTSLPTTLPSGDIFVGNGSNVATAVAMSGDATLANTGAITVGSIGGKAVALGGTFTTSGAFNVTQTYTGATSVTFPTSGTLATTAQLPTLPLSMANGGTGAALVPAVGSIPVSGASAMALLPVGTNGQILNLQSGTPAWSTATYPNTAVAGEFILGSASNVFSNSPYTLPITTLSANSVLFASTATAVGQIASANNSVLATSGTGVPAFTLALPSAVQVAVGSLNSGASASSATFWRGDGTWASPAGSGTVNAGTAGAIAYYATSTNAVSTTAAGTAGNTLLSGGSGTPTWSTLPPITKCNAVSFVAGAGTYTYTPSTGTQYVWFRMVASGGGGAGVAGGASQGAVGSGGGYGGFAETLIPVATVLGGGTTAQIVIGALGTGGAAGANPGGTGGTCTIKANGGSGATLLQCTGGVGGTASGTGAGNDMIAGSAGGIGTLGNQVNGNGAPSAAGIQIAVSYAIGSNGASGPYGAGGIGSATFGTGLNGAAGLGFGSGGGGAAVIGNANQSGGNAAPGAVWIHEYISI